LRYLDAGADRILREGRHDVHVTAVVADVAGLHTTEAVALVDRALAAAVDGALADGARPVVLAGNCHSCLGTLAGLAADVGIVWLDAHGDFNTPETSPSGYFDGMALAVAAGLAHDDLRARIGARAVPGEHILLAGVRDLDPGERDNLKRAGVQVVAGDAWRDVGAAALASPPESATCTCTWTWTSWIRRRRPG
jgi:arginase